MFFKAAPTPADRSVQSPARAPGADPYKDHLLPAWESAAAAWPARAVDIGSQTRVSVLGSPSPPSSSLCASVGPLCAAHHSHLTPCILSCPFSSAQLPPTPSCALAECFRKVAGLEGRDGRGGEASNRRQGQQSRGSASWQGRERAESERRPGVLNRSPINMG